jgi:glycosyltransferase involved in cell wall biosynthesis
MVHPEQVVVIVPCLNEAATLPALIPQIQSRVPNVIVIDDGSNDATAALAQAAGAEVIRHVQPQGKGASLIEGWRRAHQRGFRWALNMDGDGQHAPEDIPRFLSADGSAAMVLGDRSAQFDRMPWVRRWVNRWMSRRLSKIVGRDVPDTQCGFRLICLDALSKLPIKTAHFEIESELVLAFCQSGERIESVPVQVIYRDERSKIRPARDTWRWIRWWMRARRSYRISSPSQTLS